MDEGTGLAILGSFIGSKEIILKILGPTADYLGMELKTFVEKQKNNLTRIFKNAEKKLGKRIDQPGRVPPKVLKGILQEGAFCEDEVMAEYFGGVLASSKSNDLRDDRGATFIALLSRLSTYQIRSHFIFYQTIKSLFNGKDLKINLPDDRCVMEIFISLQEYFKEMELPLKSKNSAQILGHVMNGLGREHLIERGYHTGPKKNLKEFGYEVNQDGIIFIPSSLGTELFFWGYGYGNLHVSEFLKQDKKFPIDIEISIPSNAQIMKETKLEEKLKEKEGQQTEARGGPEASQE